MTNLPTVRVSPVTARAVVLDESRQLHERDVDVALDDLPASGGWLAVDACGMCGSDWSWYANRTIPAPMILGHEIVGTVTDLWGELADRADLAIGDRIVVEEAITCRTCALCRSGRHRLCQQSSRYGGTPIASAPGLWGGFADRVFLAVGATPHAVPEGVASTAGTLFVPLSNGISWISSAAAMHPGDVVVVLGPGQHGLACVAAARRLGAGTVVVAGSEGDSWRLAVATELGADVVVDIGGQSLTDIVLDLTGGLGADVVVDTTPMNISAVPDAVAMAAIGARVIIAGGKGGQLSSLDTDTMFRREITIRGVAARESWAIDLALEWLATDPEAFEAFGGNVGDFSSVEQMLLAIGGESDGDRPLHPVVVPRKGQS
jgi:alcohol dehydrogenase